MTLVRSRRVRGGPDLRRRPGPGDGGHRRDPDPHGGAGHVLRGRLGRRRCARPGPPPGRGRPHRRGPLVVAPSGRRGGRRPGGRRVRAHRRADRRADRPPRALRPSALPQGRRRPLGRPARRARVHDGHLERRPAGLGGVRSGRDRAGQRSTACTPGRSCCCTTAAAIARPPPRRCR